MSPPHTRLGSHHPAPPVRLTPLLCLVLAAPLTRAQAPAPGDVVINEVMYDPPAPQPAANEWLEVLNRSDRALSLGGVAVADEAGVSDPVPGPLVLAPGTFAVLVRDGEAFAAAYPGVPFVEVDGFPTLNNSGDRPALVLGGAELDAVPYAPSWGGADASLERRDADGPSVQANFATTTDPAGGTPGAPNSRSVPSGPPLLPGDVVLTEVMYDPALGSAGEYVEVFNATAGRAVELRDLSLGDGAPLGDGAGPLAPGQFLALVRDAAVFRSAFPDAPFVEVGGAVGLSNAGEAVVLRSGGVVLDSVFYDPGWHRPELDDATGVSLERRDPAGPSNEAGNWSSSLSERGGTPSAPNSVGLAGAPRERGGLAVTSPFAPDRGEAAEITYTLTTEAALVRARVFDGGGRFVRELEPGRLSGSTATLTWDGRDDARRPLRAGIYVLLVEAVDVAGGTTEARRAALVLAR